MKIEVNFGLIKEKIFAKKIAELEEKLNGYSAKASEIKEAISAMEAVNTNEGIAIAIAYKQEELRSVYNEMQLINDELRKYYGF